MLAFSADVQSSSPTKCVWKEGWDDTYKRHYYYNTVTEESRWDKPSEGYKPYVEGESSSSDYDDDDEEEEEDSSSDEEPTVSPKVLQYSSPVLSSPALSSPSPDVSAFKKSRVEKEEDEDPPSGAKPKEEDDDEEDDEVENEGKDKDQEEDEDGDEERRGVWEAGMRRMSEVIVEVSRIEEEKEEQRIEEEVDAPSPMRPRTANPPKKPSKGTKRKSKIKPWNYANHGPPQPRSGQTRGDPNSVHAQEAAQISVRFASNVHGDFVERQMRDVKNRERDLKRLIERDEAQGKKEREEALKLNKQTKRLLRENGMIGVKGDIWFDRLSKSRVNKMAQFLMGQRDVASERDHHHKPTFFTHKEDRKLDEESERLRKADSSRMRTNTAETALNPRRWKYLSNKDSEVGEAIKEDVLLSPQNKTGVKGHFFKQNVLGDHNTVSVKTTTKVEATEEEMMFVKAFEKHIMEGDADVEREKDEVRRKFEKERRSSVVGISLGSGGEQVQAKTFFGKDAGQRFAENAMEEEAEGQGLGGAVLSLSPTKTRNRRGRRATTSGLLVEGICKHVNKAFEDLKVDGGLDYEAFATVMGKMTFLDDDKKEDVKLVGRAWGVYSARGRVGLEACQRLFVQVLAGLQVNNSFGGSAVVDPDEEKKLVAALCVVYNERRLCQKPKHWREGNMREGLLYNKEKKNIGQGKVSAVSVKKKKRRASVASVVHTPSDHVKVAAGSLKGRTRRRASTFTTRLRKERTKGGKSNLEEWYKCTFKPEINEYSKKLDNKRWKRELEKAKAAKASGSSSGSKGKGGSERTLIKDAYEDVVHFLEKIMDAGGRGAKINKLDVEHAFDEMKDDEDHMEEARKGEEMLLSCLEGQEEGVGAEEVMYRLEDKYGGMAMEEEEFGGDGDGGLPETLRVRLEKWKVFELKKKKGIERKKVIKDKQEMKGCTFKPKLNKTTKKIAEGKRTDGIRTGKVEGRLYEEGMRKEISRRNRHQKKLERQGTEMMEREERELKEHCTFKPNIQKREVEGDEVKLEEVGGMKEWMFWNEMAKIKKEEDKEREGKMKFRKTGEHLFERWDPSMKFAKPFEFKNLEKRGLHEKRFRKTSKMKERDERRKKERDEEKAGLRKEAERVHKEAKREDWMIKRLNSHVGPPLFVLELKTGDGLVEALYVWKGDDLEDIAYQYGEARELSEEGRRELLEVMKVNYEGMIKSTDSEEGVPSEVGENGVEEVVEDKGELTVEEL